LPHLLRISWSLRGEIEAGLPSEEETKELERFENRLVPRIENDGLSVLSAVITDSGKRHWYIYVSDVDAVSNDLHNMPQEIEPYPIDLTLHRNEGWRFFRELIESCRGMTRPPGLEPHD
jgi:hypothetical protein